MADFGGDALHLAQVLLANLAAVGVAESGITFLGLGAEESMGQDGFKLANAQAGAFDAAEEGGDGGGRKGLVDGLLDLGEGLLVLNRDGGLLETSVSRFLQGLMPRFSVRPNGTAEAVPRQNGRRG